MSLNGTFVEAKIRTFKCPKCAVYLEQVSHFDPQRCNAKFSPNCDKTDYSVSAKNLGTVSIVIQLGYMSSSVKILHGVNLAMKNI
jgi:hypothetical protein